VKARLLVLAALGAALIAAPTAALGSAAHAASNSQTYADSIGEDPNAPDITGIDVSNDDAGLITFHVKISNRPQLTSDMLILVFLDTDQNASTGDPRSLGADYLIDLESAGVFLLKWDGTQFSNTSSSPSLTYAYDATGATIHVSAVDLGGTKGINFAVAATSGITIDANGNPDFTNAHNDLAPDSGHGFYNYLVLTKLTLRTIAFTTSPKPAKAGKRFTAALAATESDTQGPIKNATIACAATIKGVGVRATHALSNGVASCFWKLPKTSKGKTLHGTITVTVQGTTLTKSFSAKIS
jgi:hypothetical protein